MLPVFNAAVYLTITIQYNVMRFILQNVFSLVYGKEPTMLNN